MYCTVRWIHIEVDIWSWHLRHLIKCTVPSVPLYWCMKLSSSGVLQNSKGKFSQFSALRCGTGLGKNLRGNCRLPTKVGMSSLQWGKEVLCCCAPHGVPRVLFIHPLAIASRGVGAPVPLLVWPTTDLGPLRFLVPNCSGYCLLSVFSWDIAKGSAIQQKSVALLYSLLENLNRGFISS